MLEVGFETTFALNKAGGEKAQCTQKSTHAHLLSSNPSSCHALIFHPHEQEGIFVGLDPDAFEVIESWATLPGALKTAIVSIVRSHNPPDDCRYSYPSEANTDAKGGAR